MNFSQLFIIINIYFFMHNGIVFENIIAQCSVKGASIAKKGHKIDILM